MCVCVCVRGGNFVKGFIILFREGFYYFVLFEVFIFMCDYIFLVGLNIKV